MWLPAPADVERTHLARFMRLHGLADLAELQARSTTDVSWFTNAIIEYLDIRFQQPYRAVVDVSGGAQLYRTLRFASAVQQTVIAGDDVAVQRELQVGGADGHACRSQLRMLLGKAARIQFQSNGQGRSSAL